MRLGMQREGREEGGREGGGCMWLADCCVASGAESSIVLSTQRLPRESGRRQGKQARQARRAGQVEGVRLILLGGVLKRT